MNRHLIASAFLAPVLVTCLAWGQGESAVVRDVRWDLEQGSAWFRHGGEWKIVNLESGQITDPATGAEVPEATPAPSRPGRLPPPGRGRQRPLELAPDGSRSAVTQHGNLFVKCGEEAKRPVTADGTATLRYGTASWVYGEELDQSTGMWWSPDSNRLGFYKFDDAKVPEYHLLSGLTGLRTEVESERYPKPGDPNPIATLGILDAAAFCADAAGDPLSHVKWIDVGSADQYIYGVEWSPDSRDLLFHRLNRGHDLLELCAADAATGAVRVIVREQALHWNHHLPEMRFLGDGRRFLWASERTGFKQYDIRSLDSGSVTTLTQGQFPADRIERVDEASGDLHYSAYPSATAVHQQLMVARLDGSGQRRLTPEDEHYSRFKIAPGGGWFIATDETVARRPSTRLYTAQGKLVATLAESTDDPWGARSLRPPELTRFKSADGVTDLYGIVHFPPGFDPSREWPILVSVYGGPYFRTIVGTFSEQPDECARGYVSLRVDNRGTPGRGKVFEDATYLRLGIADLDDQAAAVTQLGKAPGMDESRVGITGMSYGGYMSALALVRYPGVFKAAVAESGPMDWRQYDSIYTERFMRTPQENSVGYDAGSVLVHSDDLKGHLMLVHGMQDDNVHPNNAWALAQKLYERDFDFELMLFPRAGHGGFGEAEESAKWRFFKEALQP